MPCSFVAELGKSDFLKQDNLSMVKHLLLRAEKQLDWSKVSLASLQVHSCQVQHLLAGCSQHTHPLPRGVGTDYTAQPFLHTVRFLCITYVLTDTACVRRMQKQSCQAEICFDSVSH